MEDTAERPAVASFSPRGPIFIYLPRSGRDAAEAERGHVPLASLLVDLGLAVLPGSSERQLEAHQVGGGGPRQVGRVEEGKAQPRAARCGIEPEARLVGLGAVVRR